MLQISTDATSRDIVLDFFAGSGATGHAVLKQNAEDGGNRRFLLVQLPEPLESASGDMRTIFDMAVARLRNVLKAEQSESGQSLNLDSGNATAEDGLRVCRLTSSNFRIWSATATPGAAEGLDPQLRLFADHILPDRSEQDILYELILKAGLSLTAKIEKKTVAEQTAYSVADGLLVICLANTISQDCLRGLIELKPERILCLDAAFGGNDQLKTNTVLEMKSHGIEFRTV